MKKITRKSLLYKSGVEYGDYTINHVDGCAHGCNFPCYAMLMAKRFGRIKSYDEWCQPKIVGNALELLDKEIPRLKHKINFVHLSFMTDPFMWGYPEVTDLSLNIIEKLNENNIKVTALTKGLLPAGLVDMNRFGKFNEFGISLVSMEESFRKDFEPNSSKYHDRLRSLHHLYENGLSTWVSIEPYPTPNIIDQDIIELLDEISFVDKIIFGRMNYNKRVSGYKEFQAFYNATVETVSEFCKRNSIELHIKKKTVKQENQEEPEGTAKTKGLFRRVFP